MVKRSAAGVHGSFAEFFLDALQLVFRGEDDARVSLVLQAQALRQWLGILHAQCVAGEWPLEAWPSWLTGPIPAGTPHAMVLH